MARAPVKWVVKKAWSCAASTPGTPARPAAPTPAGGTDGGEDDGWLLINRLADAVEVRPVPEGGKTVHVHLTAGP